MQAVTPDANWSITSALICHSNRRGWKIRTVETIFEDGNLEGISDEDLGIVSHRHASI